MRHLSHGRVVLVLTVALVLLTMAIGGSWVGEGTQLPNAFLSAWVVLVRCGSIALLWLGMAFGFGGLIVDRLGLDRRSAWERVALEGSIGVAFALWLDAALASLPARSMVGLLSGGGIVAWVLVVVGFALLILRVRNARRPAPGLDAPILLLAVAPPIGVLLLAATSEPGWLWGSEFRGYDALSYHLQLPREWLAMGGMATLEHNVYSAFPGFVEASFLHCFVLARGIDDGALASQCLAAFVTVLAAVNVGCVARRLAGAAAGVLAAAAYLAVPWVVVVGSLAYNDGFVGLFLASAILVALKPPAEPRSRLRFGVTLGLLVGAACGAKLTAVGFMAIPAALVLLVLRPREALAVGAMAGATALVVLAPWLARNGLATGNPTFPFLSGIFGTGHWSAGQMAAFAGAHQPDVPFVDRLGAIGRRWLAFGMGTNPTPREPWAMLWSIVPWLGLAGLLGLLLRRAGPARILGIALSAALAAQLAFWLLATHLQSRFLAPTATVLAIALAAALGHRRVQALAKPLTVAAIALSIGPLLVFRVEPALDHSTATVGEPAKLIVLRDVLSGDAHAAQIQGLLEKGDQDAVRALQASAPAPYWVNHYLPDDDAGGGSVVLIGEATPFWYRRSGSYATVWDRGVFGTIVASMPENPELWASALSGLGARFVFVNLVMLDNWRQRGWLDPNLTPERLEAFLSTTRPIVRHPSGLYLGELPHATASPAAPAPPAPR